MHKLAKTTSIIAKFANLHRLAQHRDLYLEPIHTLCVYAKKVQKNKWAGHPFAHRHRACTNSIACKHTSWWLQTILQLDALEGNDLVFPRDKGYFLSHSQCRPRLQRCGVTRRTRLWLNSCFSTVIQQYGPLTRRQASFGMMLLLLFSREVLKASVKRTGSWYNITILLDRS